MARGWPRGGADVTPHVFTEDELDALTAGPMGRLAGKTEVALEAEAVACVKVWAERSERRLRELRMATGVEVHAVRCPFHGWPPCPSGDGHVHQRGCLERQATVMSVRVWESDALPVTAWSEAGVVGTCACDVAAPST